jgi:hypothetical protein
MANIDPFVRHMIVCEEVELDPADRSKYTVRGVVNYIRPTEPVSFPVVVEQLCVLLEVSGGRGNGETFVAAESAESGAIVFRTPPRFISYPPDPLLVSPILFRIRQCVFREPGLYWIQVWHNGRKLGEQSLVVRA